MLGALNHVVPRRLAASTGARAAPSAGFPSFMTRRPRVPCWRRRSSIGLDTAAPRRNIAARVVNPDLLTDPDVPVSKLQELLDEAIDREDYGDAAQLRDALQKRRFDNRHAVEEVNDRFYRAFQSGSLKEMGSVWGAGDHVQCIHPLAGCIAGRSEVMESWRAILAAGRMKIKLEDIRIYASDSHAYVTCVEVMEASDSRGRILATNIFEKQHGQWKLVHHHGSPMRSLR